MRTMIGLSLGVTLVLAGTAACSSKSVDDDDDNKGGTGAIITAGGGGTSAGTSSNTGGTGSNAAGTSSGGASSMAGTGTAGTATMPDLCAGKTVSCVDAMTARACDPETGMDVTGNCAEELAKDGLVSTGCSTEADGTGCTIDDYSDMGCFEGTEPFSVCAELGPEDALTVYVACFRDIEGLHAIIPCFADFVDDTVTPPTIDCMAAETACFPPAMP